MIELITPRMEETVVLLQEKHLSYIAEPTNDPTSRVDWLNLRAVQDDLSFPREVELTYTPAIDGEVHLVTPDRGVLVIPAQNGRATVTNLLIGATYQWYVIAGGEASDKRTFYTDPQVPRMLFVEGISNVRDFGGFPTADGKHRIKQGLILRTSEMDTHVEITEAGKQTLLDLGVRVDLDIRGIKDEHRAPILDERRVKWLNYPLAAYGEIFCDVQVARYGESYKLLADCRNYPQIIHCWGGIDRTGCWLYILGGMLGVCEDLLGLDYEMSSFSRWNRRSRLSEQFGEFLNGLYQYGDTLQTACEGFMRAGGVTDDELQAIRTILLEEI